MRAAVLSACLVLGLAACQGGASPEPAPTSSNPYGGFPVDPPAPDEVVLTVTGTRTIYYTMSELESMADVTISITEPFVQKQQEFSGVPLGTLFAEAGLTPDQSVATIALNDYIYTDTVAAFEGSQALLAVFRDGQAIPMDQGGPIRIVFPEGSDYYNYLDAWNWSVRTIEPRDMP